MPQILLVEDEEAHVELIRRAFAKRNEVALDVVSTLRDARERLGSFPRPDLAIIDLLLPDGRGTDLIGRDSNGDFPVVVMTSHGDEQVAVEAIKAGALDYVVKSEGTLADLPRTADRALREWGHIEERRRAEEALHASEEHFRSLIENALDVIMVLDAQGLIEYASPSTETILGQSPGEILGRRLHDFVHPDDERALGEMLESLSETPRISAEYRLRHCDGSWHTVESLASGHPHGEGDRRRIVINSRDVTRRRVADEARRASESRHRTLVDSLPVCILELDAEGRVLTINQEGLRMLEVESEEHVRGRSFLELPEEEDRQTVEGCLARALEGGRSDFEFRLDVNGNGKVFSSGLVALRDPTGAITRVIGYSQDVTERRRAQQEKQLLEQQLRQSQKMEALGQLASGVAHDFNNLLTVIAGHTAFLEMTSDGASSRGSEHIDAIRRALERASSLSRQLLAFGRRQVMRPVVLDLSQTVTNVHGMLRRLIGEHIRLRFEAAESVGRIKADPVQLEQAILNLAVNARDAMPMGGNLIVTTRGHSSDESATVDGVTIPEGHYAVLEVFDDGCGMSAETKAQIFEPFFTTKPRGKGTGLGLSTVYGMVRQSGGQIAVESEIDRGTTIRIFLPTVAESVAVSDSKVAAVLEEHGSESILVAEDDDATRSLVREVLVALGYSVITAADGEEAAKFLNRTEQPVDLLLTDLVMPGMNGRDLADRFRQHFGAGQVLYMSGYADDTLGPQVALDSSEAFLEKPFLPGALARKVREVLDRRNEEQRVESSRP